MSHGLDVLIAGGGTGGHVFPALALGSALVERDRTVAFAGTPTGLEARLVPAAGRTLHLLPGRQLRGGGLRGAMVGAASLARGFAGAVRLLGRLRPRLVVGVGGYASVAGVLAARSRRVPVILLEQNAIPGAANRNLGRMATRVCVGFAEAAPFFPAGRAIHTGNPVRPEVLATPPRPRRDGLGVLIFGGSQGAHHLNEAGVAAVEALAGAGGPLRVRHQTGVTDQVAIAQAYRRLGVDARVDAFVDDMGGAYRDADVVVSRAGAMSCAEITAMGLPAILVPYPYAADDHQRRNAEIIAAAGGARVILDRDLDGRRLADALAPLLADPATRTRMADCARALGRPEAAAHVARICIEVLERRST